MTSESNWPGHQLRGWSTKTCHISKHKVLCKYPKLRNKQLKCEQNVWILMCNSLDAFQVRHFLRISCNVSSSHTHSIMPEGNLHVYTHSMPIRMKSRYLQGRTSEPCSSNTPISHSGGSGFKSMAGDCLSPGLSWLSSVRPGKCQDYTFKLGQKRLHIRFITEMTFIIQLRT
jgi:hypothetical protein